MASLQKHCHYSEEWVKALQFSLLGRKLPSLRSGALEWHSQALVTPSLWNPVIREHFLSENNLIHDEKPCYCWFFIVFFCLK